MKNAHSIRSVNNAGPTYNQFGKKDSFQDEENDENQNNNNKESLYYLLILQIKIFFM